MVLTVCTRAGPRVANSQLRDRRVGGALVRLLVHERLRFLADQGRGGVIIRHHSAVGVWGCRPPYM